VRFVGVTWGIGKRHDMETAGARDFVDHMRELLGRTGVARAAQRGTPP
jgi:phosphoglycolate phosphatase-like HAD superfamily hydrolase